MSKKEATRRKITKKFTRLKGEAKEANFKSRKSQPICVYFSTYMCVIAFSKVFSTSDPPKVFFKI